VPRRMHHALLQQRGSERLGDGNVDDVSLSGPVFPISLSLSVHSTVSLSLSVGSRGCGYDCSPFEADSRYVQPQNALQSSTHSKVNLTHSLSLFISHFHSFLFPIFKRDGDVSFQIDRFFSAVFVILQKIVLKAIALRKPKVRSLSFTVHCSLSLFTVHCSLFTVHCSLFTVHCLFLSLYRNNPKHNILSSSPHWWCWSYPDSKKEAKWAILPIVLSLVFSLPAMKVFIPISHLPCPLCSCGVIHSFPNFKSFQFVLFQTLSLSLCACLL